MSEEKESFEQKVYKSYKILFDLHQELFNLCGAIADECNKNPIAIEILTGVQKVIGFLDAKAFKTYVAINILCKSGAGQDAEILLRSMIEIFISVKYLTKEDSENRANMYIDFFDYKTARDIEKLKDYPMIGAKLKEHEEKYKSAKKDFLERYDVKNKNSWSGKDISKMAEESGLSEIYDKAYNASSNMVHSNILCSPEYLSIHEGHFDFNAGPSVSCIERTLASSIECLLNIQIEFDKAFNLKNDSKIKDFIEKYHKGIKEFKGGKNASPNS